MLVSQTRWPVIPFGADGGIVTEGDALPRVTESADGTNLNEIWAKLAAALAVWNQSRSALASLLTFQHTNASDAIPQTLVLPEFEEATEFGEPESIRPIKYLRLGYLFDHFDAATRFSWRALMAMTQEQVMATHNYALEADQNKVNRDILARLFSPEQFTNENETPVYGFWSGDDGMTPPAYKGKSFTNSHSHYLVSGADEIDSGDVEALARTVAEHGYNSDPQSQLLLLAHPDNVDKISSFKAGEVSANDVVARHDYIPSEGTPAFYAPNEIVGQRAPAKVEGLKIAGSYSSLWVVPLDDIPDDYLAVVSTYGNNSPNNAIGFREHPVSAYRGLRHIPGPVPGYPLQESFYTRAFGLGVRRRGQAAVMQIKAAGAYESPEILFA